MTIVGPEEYILTSIGVTIIIKDIMKQFTSPTACIDKDVGAGEHVIDFLQGPDAFSDETSSKFGYLLAQIWHVTCGINDNRMIGPTTVEIGRIFSRF